MIVAVWFSASDPSEIQGAGSYLGAGPAETLYAVELIREAAEELRRREGVPLSLRRQREYNLGAAGVLTTEQDDVVVTVQWDPSRRLVPPVLDYLQGATPTPGHLYAAAGALQEIVRFRWWRQMTEIENREARGRMHRQQAPPDGHGGPPRVLN